MLFWIWNWELRNEVRKKKKKDSPVKILYPGENGSGLSGFLIWTLLRVILPFSLGACSWYLLRLLWVQYLLSNLILFLAPLWLLPWSLKPTSRFVCLSRTYCIWWAYSHPEMVGCDRTFSQRASENEIPFLIVWPQGIVLPKISWGPRARDNGNMLGKAGADRGLSSQDPIYNHFLHGSLPHCNCRELALTGSCGFPRT